ncbi:MAG TPA: HPr-rel-A system PqqD family peptide chaperone [Actinomycetota bacterium]|nr:HPr-rel-A system PqqD family peptide chaperone [Actinomycetota bacterium]
MKVADAMYVEWVEGEAVVLNRDSGELHYLNGPAALVFALIQEHGFDRALEEVRDRFGAEQVEADLDDLVSDMKEKGILVDG